MSKKRKAPSQSRVTNDKILRKAFDHLIETLPIVTIRCSDGQVSTKLLWFYRAESDCLAHAYDVPDPMGGIELIADEFCRKEVAAAIRVMSDASIVSLQVDESEMRYGESIYDPALIVGALKFLDKHLILSVRRYIIRQLPKPRELHPSEQVDYIRHYIERGLDVGDGYYRQLICWIARDVKIYSALLKPHHKLFAEAGVYEQICHAGT